MLEPDAEWVSNPGVYLFWAKQNVSDPTGTTGDAMRISRFDHVENSGGLSSRGSLSSERELWVDTDGFVPVDDSQYQVSNVLWHYGGQLSVGPNANLYLSLGDKHHSDWVGQADKYAGCVVRIGRDGSIPDGNLDPSIKPAACWAFGVRNAYRSSWDLEPAGQERYFLGEVGGNNPRISWEDIHVLAADGTDSAEEQRKNLGWPSCEGGCDNPDFPSCSCDRHDDPVFSYRREEGGCVIGGGVYRDTQFPAEYRGAYFFGDFERRFIKYIAFASDGSREVESVNTFVEHTDGKPVAFAFDRTGSLWYIDDPIDAYKFVKISYTADSSGNIPPRIVYAAANTTEGGAPFAVKFNGAAADANGDVVTYAWRFGDGDEDASSAVAEHVYASPGVYHAQLTVSDGSAPAHSELLQIVVGTPPTLVIVSPMATVATEPHTQFEGGDVIEFAAVASDAMHGNLTSAIEWDVSFAHNTHFHPMTSSVGPTGSLTVPRSGHSFEGTAGFRFTARVINSDGLISRRSVVLWPHKVNLSFTIEPAALNGTSITVDGYSRERSLVLDTMVGFVHSIGAPELQCHQNGTSFRLTAWDIDGVSEPAMAVAGPTEDIRVVVPSHAAAVVARYTAEIGATASAHCPPPPPVTVYDAVYPGTADPSPVPSWAPWTSLPTAAPTPTPAIDPTPAPTAAPTFRPLMMYRFIVLQPGGCCRDPFGGHVRQVSAVFSLFWLL